VRRALAALPHLWSDAWLSAVDSLSGVWGDTTRGSSAGMIFAGDEARRYVTKRGGCFSDQAASLALVG